LIDRYRGKTCCRLPGDKSESPLHPGEKERSSPEGITMIMMMMMMMMTYGGGMMMMRRVASAVLPIDVVDVVMGV